MDYFTLETLWQAVGFIALFYVFLAFKETNDRKLISYLAIGSGIWAIHFSLLWLIAAAAINLFDVFKNLAWLRYEKNNYWVSFFIICYIIIGLVSYSFTWEYISFFPTVSSVLGAVAVFYFRGISLRIIMISTLFIWFAYNFIGGSYAGMASDISLMWATLYGMWKLKRFPLTKNVEEIVEGLGK